DDLSSTHMTFNFEVIVRKEDWNIDKKIKPDIAMAFHVPNHGDLLLQLEFIPSRNEHDYSIFSSAVAVKKTLEFTKLYYKYLIFPFQLTPVEFIFINKPNNDEVDNCFRRIDVPRYVDRKDIFDSCIYPQQVDSDQGMFSKLLFWQGKSLKVPDTAHNLEYCAEAHLRREFNAIEQCEIRDVNQVYEKILSVHSSLSNARKANIVDKKDMDFYDSNASKVCN
uniref:Uncharacterized protein n=1 Tax=Amphimedon queenslandica TaxID=400682 RepID=A0A1X7TM97_AMPQE